MNRLGVGDWLMSFVDSGESCKFLQLTSSEMRFHFFNVPALANSVLTLTQVTPS